MCLSLSLKNELLIEGRNNILVFMHLEGGIEYCTVVTNAISSIIVPQIN